MQINRNILKHLLKWKTKHFRKPLLLRGARQVGKTYIARELSKSFSNFIELNLYDQPRIARLFEDDMLSVDQIIESIGAFFRIRIVDGETLLFIDEIQASTKAIERLRFFYEKRPNLHVIATGSLLDFALEDTNSFGVGRVEYLYMYPVTFYEFVTSIGEELLLEQIKKATHAKPLSDLLHLQSLNLLKNYLTIGGMPEVLANYLETRDLNISSKIISDIITGYEDDFAKYNKRLNVSDLRETFRSSVLQVGKKFIYSHAFRDANSKVVHKALDLIVKAGIAHKVFHTAGNGVPLGGEVDMTKFKTLPLDMGIFNRMSGMLFAEFALMNPLDLINKGALAEAYCGLEILWNKNPETKESMFYWHREAKSSNAEVDYLINIGAIVYPVEVKSSGTGSMHSMRRFLTEKNKAQFGVRVSTENFGRYQDVITVPLYAVGEIERVVSAEV